MKFSRIIIGLVVALVLPHHAAVAGQSENESRFISATGVMRLITKTDLTPTGADSNARGNIKTKLTRQGNVSIQQVEISVVNLDKNTTYGLVAFVGTDILATDITEFTTDNQGRLNVTYVKKSQDKVGPRTEPLPAALDPLCNVRELSIVNSSRVIVLRGILTNPNHGTYLVNLPMNSTGFVPVAQGNVQIKANARSTKFGLQASGLAPRTVYSLMINGSIIRAKTSDNAGRLMVKELPLWVPDVLDIHRVALADGSGDNVVLTVDGLGIPCDSTVAIITPPAVTATSPLNLATNVPINSQFVVAFDKAMDTATFNSNTFSVSDGDASVSGSVSNLNGMATFSPTTSLRTNTFYTATVTTGMKDLFGHALTNNYVWSFTTGSSTDNTLPTVTSTIPTNSATGVAVNIHPSATFSKAMNAGTITNTTFTLQHGSTMVTGTVSYVSHVATFVSAASLLTNTIYTATITTGAMDLAGNALATNFIWSFKTGSSADTNPPTVVSSTPVNFSTNVPVNQTINATFSEPMEVTTISSNSFMVAGPGSTNISGIVNYVPASRIATFTPATNLAPNTTYTNTITIGATDLAGNPLTTRVVWIFTTGTQNDTNRMSIPLGAASTFAILATAAINGSGNHITGDVGLHPGTAQGIAPSEINGTIHVNDQAVIDAQASLLAAYNEAVSRSVNSQLLEGNLGGLTKLPGLYENGSSSGISGTGANAILTLDAQGDANAVFVFKMASTLVTGSGTSIVLAGGAQAKNVYWQVGSSATLGTTSSFKGNLLAFVTITVNSGSKVDGRLFAGSGGDASGAVTTQSSTITLPAP